MITNNSITTKSRQHSSILPSLTGRGLGVGLWLFLLLALFCACSSYDNDDNSSNSDNGNNDHLHRERTSRRTTVADRLELQPGTSQLEATRP